jgi:hypothetical protein
VRSLMFRALAISGAFRPCFLKDACSLRFCLCGSFLSALVNSTRLGNPDSGSLSFPLDIPVRFRRGREVRWKTARECFLPDRLGKELLAIRGEEVEGGIAHAQHHLPRWGRPAVEQRGSCVDMGSHKLVAVSSSLGRLTAPGAWAPVDHQNSFAPLVTCTI